jgi:flagellar hook-associated protein 2
MVATTGVGSTAASSTGAITSAVGVATGLDTTAIINALMAVDKQPLNKMQAKQADYKTQISAWGDLSSSMSALRTALYALKSGVTKTTTAVASQTSTNKTLLTAAVSSKAANGTYSVTVDQLAVGERLSSKAFDTADAAFNTGTLIVGTGANLTTVNIDSTNNTLTGVMNAINKSGTNVTASISKDDAGYRLQLSANSVGAGSKIQVITSDDSSDNNTLNNFFQDREFGGAMQVSQSAQDSRVIVDGRTTTSSSNTVVNAIGGVTMKLTQSSTEAVNVTVSQNQAVDTTNISAFITAYNATMAKAKDMAVNDPTLQTGAQTGVLKNNGTLQGIIRQLQNITTSQYSGHSLVEVGITHDKTGVLQLDTAMFTKFSTADITGLSQTIGNMADTMTGNIGTMITSSIQTTKVNLTSKVSRLTQQEAELQTNLDKKKAAYVKKFSALETTVSQLQSQGTSMTAMTSGNTSGK